MRTNLGKVSTRPGDSGSVTLQHIDAATATNLNVFFGNAQNQYRDLIVHVFGIEKPSVAGAGLVVQVSTNGATLESGNVYSSVTLEQSATSALTATGASGVGSMLVHQVSPFTLATATGKGSADGLFYIHHAGGTDAIHISWEWHFLNSASSAAQAQGSGYFPTGPCAGVSFNIGGGTFNGSAIVYGVSKIGP